MAYSIGGGYWLWKPYIIWKTLQDYGNDAIVVYVDAGCSLSPCDDWNFYLKKMDYYDTIVFKYKDNFDYGWKDHFRCDSPQIKFWTKKNTLIYFDSLYHNEKWRNCNKIWAGFIIAKNNRNKLIEQWLDISLLYPQLVINPIGEEIENQYIFFSTHRHDQSILTPLAYYFHNTDQSVFVLDETAESGILQEQNNIAVLARRQRDIKMPRITLKTRTIWFIKSVIGERMYNLLHG